MAKGKTMTLDPVLGSIPDSNSQSIKSANWAILTREFKVKLLLICHGKSENTS